MNSLHTLTLDQNKASEAFIEFLLSDNVEMVISGGAGVGKTTLLQNLIDQFAKHKQILDIVGTSGLDKIVVAATTNKAAAVAGEMLGIEVSTIHSLLGLRVYNDHQTGETKLTEGNKPSSNLSNALVVIDECSMIDRELYGYIHKGAFNCKFLYMGDHCQMAPVKESISPVFKRGLNFFNLTEIIRSKNTPTITELCQKLRHTVETGEFFEIIENHDTIQYLDDDQMREQIQKHFVDESTNSRIMCYTNKRVKEYNSLIRRMRGLSEDIQIGEILVSNQVTNNINSSMRLNIEEEIEIYDVNPEILFKYNCIDVKEVLTHKGRILIPVSVDRYHELIKHFSRLKDWTSYFNLKNNIADLRPRDACTVYKAQGSTYDNAFVDIGNIGTCNIPSQTARMLYVACSRPKEKIYLYGELPEKYRK